MPQSIPYFRLHDYNLREEPLVTRRIHPYLKKAYDRKSAAPRIPKVWREATSRGLASFGSRGEFCGKESTDKS